MLIPANINSRAILNSRQHKLVITLYIVDIIAILLLCAVLVYFIITVSTSLPSLIQEARTGIGAIRKDVAQMAKNLEDLDRKFPNITDA